MHFFFKSIKNYLKFEKEIAKNGKFSSKIGQNNVASCIFILK